VDPGKAQPELLDPDRARSSHQRLEVGTLTNYVEVVGTPGQGSNVKANDSEEVIVPLSYTGTDLVFALDTSGSMKNIYRVDLDESADIVSGFSSFGDVNISVLSWDERSELIFGPAPLTGNESRLAEILDNLSDLCVETEFTYYDQGLNGSIAALRDRAAPFSRSAKVVVLVSGFGEFKSGDGLDDYISEAKRSGYRVFTIGVGINESFEDSRMQYTNLAKISDATGGEFYSVTAFSSEEINPVMNEIASEVRGEASVNASEI
jgi:hypothetical protein